MFLFTNTTTKGNKVNSVLNLKKMNGTLNYIVN